jgi:hypothetical protein
MVRTCRPSQFWTWECSTTIWFATSGGNVAPIDDITCDSGNVECPFREHSVHHLVRHLRRESRPYRGHHLERGGGSEGTKTNRHLRQMSSWPGDFGPSDDLCDALSEDFSEDLSEDSCEDL